MTRRVHHPEAEGHFYLLKSALKVRFVMLRLPFREVGLAVLITITGQGGNSAQPLRALALNSRPVWPDTPLCPPSRRPLHRRSL